MGFEMGFVLRTFGGVRIYVSILSTHVKKREPSVLWFTPVPEAVLSPLCKFRPRGRPAWSVRNNRIELMRNGTPLYKNEALVLLWAEGRDLRHGNFCENVARMRIGIVRAAL